MATYHDVTSYPIATGEFFLIDTCVWISLLSSQGFPGDKTPPSVIETYSNFLEKITENGKVTILLLGVSELYNRFIKNTYNEYLKTNNLNSRNFDFKNSFRIIPEFQQAKTFIEKNIDEVILEIASKEDDNFSCSCVKSILQRKNDDFNDSYFLQYCETKAITFVTHDIDAKNYSDMNVKIVTANKTLLRSI